MQTGIDVAIEDRQLVVAVTGQTLDLFALDLQRTLVLFHAVAVEDAHLDDRAEITRLARRSDVSRTSDAFSPKMARSSFSSGVIGLSPFGVILPTRISPGSDIGTDIDDARLVEVAQGFLADVGDVAGDLFRPKLGVTRGDFEFLDVDRGEDVVAA